MTNTKHKEGSPSIRVCGSYECIPRIWKDQLKNVLETITEFKVTGYEISIQNPTALLYSNRNQFKIQGKKYPTYKSNKNKHLYGHILGKKYTWSREK